ncbi:MAG: hypothetical protein NTU83_11860 [Candidatus Hydrogenedentes bacterium]|nr:hypothetical protein [Candidatus Hydrogenedentota bacterium]
MSGATTRTLTIDSVEPGDAGTYTCGYKNSNNVAKLSEPYTLVVYEPGSLPATGVVGTAFLAGLVALSGLAAICLRRGRVAS